MATPAPQDHPTVLTRPTPPSSTDRDVMARLRRFHLGARDESHPFATELRPAVLAGITPAGVDVEDVLWLTVRADGPTATTLGERLDQLVPDDQRTRILRSQRGEFAGRIAERARASNTPIHAASTLADAGAALVDSLALKKEDQDRLAAELGELVDEIAPDERFFAPTDWPHVALLRVALDTLGGSGRAQMTERAAKLSEALRRHLDVDLANRPGVERSRSVASILGEIGNEFVNPSALADLLGSRSGKHEMSDADRARVTATRDELQRFVDADPSVVPTLLHDGVVGDPEHPVFSGWHVVRHEDPLAESAARFDANAHDVATVVAAARRAEMELDYRYDPERHDPWFAHFTWEGFTRSELRLLTPIVVMVRAQHLVEGALTSLSRLLLSGRPIQIVVLTDPAGVAGNMTPLSGFRFEPGYIGMGHREAVVCQGSTARAPELLAGFTRAARSARTSLHVIAGGPTNSDESPSVGERAYAALALHGRAHPVYHYDPEAGVTWARRFELTANPGVDVDWPTCEVAVRTDGDETESWPRPITFADFALAEPALAAEFCPVPPALASDDLVPVETLFDQTDEDVAHRLPYVWGMNTDGVLQRVAISRRLWLACRDRLTFWRTLQELAGVHNAYVEAAERRIRDEAEARVQQEREQNAAQHEIALNEARERAAMDVVHRLTDALLGDGPEIVASDLLGAGSIAPSTNSTAAAATPATTPESEAAAAEAPEGPIMPSIDTELCTTCNECTNLNPQMFAYNENKQAVIKDPRGGPFKDLVQAAEKCPAFIIHPGTPLNPDEPGLEALIKRAEKFN